MRGKDLVSPGVHDPHPCEHKARPCSAEPGFDIRRCDVGEPPGPPPPPPECTALRVPPPRPTNPSGFWWGRRVGGRGRKIRAARTAAPVRGILQPAWPGWRGITPPLPSPAPQISGSGILLVCCACLLAHLAQGRGDLPAAQLRALSHAVAGSVCGERCGLRSPSTPPATPAASLLPPPRRVADVQKHTEINSLAFRLVCCANKVNRQAPSHSSETRV